MFITLNGTEYELAATLRVAYKLQGYNNHKPYIEIFRDIGEMGVEKQIEILYAAFEVANPQVKEIWSKTHFTNCLLDTYNVSELMKTLEKLTKEIMGMDEDAIPEAEAESKHKPEPEPVIEDNTPTDFQKFI